jgi:hypothetical protein
MDFIGISVSPKGIDCLIIGIGFSRIVFSKEHSVMKSTRVCPLIVGIG